MSYRMAYVYLVTPSTLTTLTSALGLVIHLSMLLVLARYNVCMSACIVVCLYWYGNITNVSSDISVYTTELYKLTTDFQFLSSVYLDLIITLVRALLH